MGVAFIAGNLRRGRIVGGQFAVLSPPVERAYPVEGRANAAAGQLRRQLIDERLDVAAADGGDPLGTKRRLDVDPQDLLDVIDCAWLVAGGFALVPLRDIRVAAPGAHVGFP